MGGIVPGEWNEQVVEAMRLERWPEAAALCTSALKQHPGALELRYRLGLCQVQLGQPLAADDNWQECAAAGHLESHFQLGLLVLRQGGGVRKAANGLLSILKRYCEKSPMVMNTKAWIAFILP